MSIRVILCLLYVIFFAVYAWRNWYVSLNAAVLLMAFFQHPDMPKSILGIQGLNPWNLLMLNVTLAWLSQRSLQGYVWDLPRTLTLLLVGFAIIIGWAFLRLALKPAYLEDYSFLSGLSEYFINNVKWLLIAVMYYDSCRDESHSIQGVLCVIMLYLLLAIQVIRWVPLGAAVSGSEDFARISYKLIQNEVGYNRVTMSNILGGACWAGLALYTVVHDRMKKLGILFACGLITLGQALTGGRTGYISWAAVGFIMCALRWRRLLLLIPVVLFAVVVFMPGVRDRMLFGTGEDAEAGQMTSGRTLIWPHVVEYIGKQPLTGYGRLAMQRTGLTDWLLVNLGEDNFGHPHNAYLELLFDNGLIGFCIIFPLYFIITRRSLSLFLDTSHPLYTIVGGAASAIIIALLIGSLAGQTFYPREGAAGMWALIGIMLRVSEERKRLLEQGIPLFGKYEAVSASYYPTAEEEPQLPHRLH